MIVKEKNGLSFLQFPKLAACSGIAHGVFTRKGGFSEGAYRSLNVSFGVGDDDRNIRRNRSIIAGCFDGREPVVAKQVHGTRVIVLARDQGAATGTPPAGLPVGDAMVTDIRDKYLLVQVADCQPVLLYDAVRHVVANVHSGWRGSVKNIIGVTIAGMQGAFDCRPRDIIAAIGPSLGPCCAEFVNYKKEIPQVLWKYKDDADRFDLWAISRDQLCQAGVLRENIHLSKICTRCNADRFFSYRGEHTTGRFAVVIGLR